MNYSNLITLQPNLSKAYSFEASQRRLYVRREVVINNIRSIVFAHLSLFYIIMRYMI